MDTHALLQKQRNKHSGFFCSRKTVQSDISTLIFTALFLLFLLLPSSSDAKKSNTVEGNVYPEKYAAFVMDADSGLILHRENANKALHPASLTKMMTLLMVFDALDKGKLKPHHRIQISSHAASMVPSKLDLPVGSTIKVSDAIKALVTKSANDVAVAVAEKLGGSEARFARMMTKKARSLGMTRTRFRNASGLHDVRQVSTARDMARLARALMTKHKSHYHHFSRRSFTYKGKTYNSHNKLMKTYPGMDGLKTGYIRASGFNLVSSAVRDDHRLIGVVFGGRTGKLRNAQMKMLLDNAFSKINSLRIANRYIPVPQQKPKNTAVLATIEPVIHTPMKAGYPDIKNAAISHWDMLYAPNENSVLKRMIGEGDYDEMVRNRIETGLIAISAHLNETIPSSVFGHEQKTSKSKHLKLRETDDWAIQIGAFTTRDNTDKALAQTYKDLPSNLQHGNAIIAPVETTQGWIYRGRLLGYTKQAANTACEILENCIIISPHSN